MIEKIKQALFERYSPIHYECSCGYTLEDGRMIVVFWNISKRRDIHVYLNDKGILMPYFPENRK